MDKLFDTYKQIVDRAISLGLLSEETKSYYLSACEEEVASDSTFKASNSSDIQVEQELLQAIFKSSPNVSRSNSEETKQNVSPTVEFEAKKTPSVDSADCNDQISVAGRSIENFSILDLNNFIKMANSIDSDSELSDILKTANNVFPGDYREVKLNKVRKKPKKNEVVDFHIPIYLDINRKKVSTKPSKVKRHFSFHDKERIGSELSSVQNDGDKKAHDEKVMKKASHRAFKSKHCSKISKHVNPTNNNTSNLRKCVSNIYDPDYKFKYINQNMQGISSPKKIQKKACSRGVVLPSPTFKCSKNRSCLESFMITNESVTNPKVKKGNVDCKDKPPTTFQSFYEREADENINHGSKYALFRSSNSRRLALGPSPIMHEFKTLSKLSRSENCVSKHEKECKHLEKPESPSDGYSWNESTDSEVKERSKEKLVNVNIICQFFSNDSSGDKQDSSSEKSSSQSEQVENEKKTIEPEAELPEEKRNRRSTSHFFSKLFSRTRTH